MVLTQFENNLTEMLFKWPFLPILFILFISIEKHDCQGAGYSKKKKKVLSKNMDLIWKYFKLFRTVEKYGIQEVYIYNKIFKNLI